MSRSSAFRWGRAASANRYSAPARFLYRVCFTADEHGIAWVLPATAGYGEAVWSRNGVYKSKNGVFFFLRG